MSEETDTQTLETTTTEADATAETEVTSTLGVATAEGGAEGETETETVEEEANAPETYDLKLTAEDGTDAALDPALVEAATPILKDVGLTNEQANKLVGIVPKIQERLVQQQNDAFAETRAQWVKDAQADAEIGGKNWKSTLGLAAKALDHFVGPVTTKDDKGNDVPNAFRKLLDESGLGEHPEMIRAFSKIGAAVAEDGTFPRSETVAVKKSREESMYPDDVPKK